MGERLHRLTIGELTLTIISEGISLADGSVWPGVEASRWADAARLDERGRFPLPMAVAYLETPSGGVLLDAGLGEDSEWSRAFFGQFGVTREAQLLPTLAEIGVRPEDVRAVVISHAHGDHYYGVTVERGGGRRPTFLLAGGPGLALLANARRPPPPRPPDAGLGGDGDRPGRDRPPHAGGVARPPRRSHRIGRPDRLLHRRPGPPHRRDRASRLDTSLGRSRRAPGEPAPHLRGGRPGRRDRRRLPPAVPGPDPAYG
jgi:hypothetical protein